MIADLTPETVVLQSLPGIGDMIWHLPVIRALASRDPTGRIDLVARQKLPARELLQNENFVNGFIALPMGRGLAGRLSSIRNLAKKLSDGKYRRIVILHDSIRYAIAAKLAGIPEIYGYGFQAGQRFFLTQDKFLENPRDISFPLDRAQKLLEIMSGAKADAHIQLHAGVKEITQISECYAEMPKPWIGFGIGATELLRTWPAERFAAIADDLWDAGYRSLFLLGASHEKEAASAIQALCLKAKPVQVTDRPLQQSIALISQCAFILSNDSGLMNVAGALQVPVYVPFGALFRSDGLFDFSSRLATMFGTAFRPVFPEKGVDRIYGASQIPIESMREKLLNDGWLKKSGVGP